MVRNADQVVCSNFRNSMKKPRPHSPIFMVSQLWLWKLSNFVISAHSFEQGLDHLHGHKHKLKCQPNLRSYSYEPLLIMGCLIATCIEKFGRPEVTKDKGKANTYPPTLDLFESQVVSILTEVKRYLESPKRNYIDFDKEKDFHHALLDVHSELAMIKHFLSQQQKILSRLFHEHETHETLPPSHYYVPQTLADKDHGNGYSMNWRFVDKAQMMLGNYQDRVDKIDGDAERIGASVQDMLNFKRTCVPASRTLTQVSYLARQLPA